MMSEIANPHDSFFKDLLARPEMVLGFLADSPYIDKYILRHTA